MAPAGVRVALEAARAAWAVAPESRSNHHPNPRHPPPLQLKRHSPARVDWGAEPAARQAGCLLLEPDASGAERAASAELEASGAELVVSAVAAGLVASAAELVASAVGSAVTRAASAVVRGSRAPRQEAPRQEAWQEARQEAPAPSPAPALAPALACGWRLARRPMEPSGRGGRGWRLARVPSGVPSAPAPAWARAAAWAWAAARPDWLALLRPKAYSVAHSVDPPARLARGAIE